jgi:benzoyl-CoA reductase/2-hydroxyglutaryl-CoA dehydratase subunit BcrC/BadD/HgdB
LEPSLEKIFNDTTLIDHYFHHVKIDKQLVGIRALLNLTLNFNQRLKIAKANGVKVAGINGFTPTEAFYSTGMVPVGLGRSGIFNVFLSDSDKNIIRLAEENGLKWDNCLRLKGTFGSLIAGSIPMPDLIVCSGSFCDNLTKLSELMAEFWPVHYLDVPTKINPAARVRMQQEYCNLLTRLGDLTGRRASQEELCRQITLENKLRNLIQELYRLMAVIPSPIDGLGGYIAQLPPFDWLGVPEQLVHVYETLITELRERIVRGYSPVNPNMARVVIAGNGTINFRFFDLIEELGGIVVGIEARYALVSQLIEPGGDIISSIADWILRFPLRGGALYRFTKILSLVRQQQAVGVIYNACWGCRHLYGSAKVIQDLLARERIPMIVLDLGTQGENLGQIQTRIGAFLETLKKEY